MNFDTFLSQAWHDHANEPLAVAQRLGGGLGFASGDGDVTRLAHLAHHVHGAHLADWEGGIVLIDSLSAPGRATRSDECGAALRRYRSSLTLASGHAIDSESYSRSNVIRVCALAAANLAEHDAANGGAALESLFGWETLGLIERAAGNPAAHVEALNAARQAFDSLDPSEQSWCTSAIAELAEPASS